MPRPKVMITNDAIGRYKQGGGQGELNECKIANKLYRIFLDSINRYGAAKVSLDRGLFAICKPDFSGVWAVVTVVKEESA